MYQMSQAEILKFLTASPHTSKLSNVCQDGTPHVVPIWFIMDGNELVFTTWHPKLKANNLHLNPEAAVFIDDENPPYAFVLLEDKVTFSEDLRELRHWATRIGGKYMGADQAKAFGICNGIPGELLGSMSIDRWVEQANIAD